MLYKISSNSSHCLFGELPYASTRVFDIPELRLQLIHFSLRYRAVEHPKLRSAACRPRFKCGLTFPTVCLTPERWMGLRDQSTVGCFPELCFLQFSVVQVLVEFLIWASAAGFNNKNNYYS